MKQLQSFFLGILAALGALFLEILFLNFSEPLSYSANNAPLQSFSSFGFIFFLSIFIEELLKALFIFKILSKEKNITRNSFFLGLGFSLLEISLVYWNFRFGREFDLSGIIGIGIIHISTAVIIGYFLEKKTKSRIRSLLSGLILAFFTHSLYNILSSSEIEHQKQLIVTLLSFLFFANIFFLIKSQKNKPLENI